MSKNKYPKNQKRITVICGTHGDVSIGATGLYAECFAEVTSAAATLGRVITSSVTSEYYQRSRNCDIRKDVVPK